MRLNSLDYKGIYRDITGCVHAHGNLKWYFPPASPGHEALQRTPVDDERLARHVSEVAVIKISLLGLANYMAASPVSQRKILRDFKYPKPEGEVKRTYYAPARYDPCVPQPAASARVAGTTGAKPSLSRGE